VRAAHGAHPGRVVIVEDDRPLGEALRRSLLDAGHRVQLFGTGRALREYLEIRVPELVLLDLSLPDEKGMDLISWIKGLAETISVIVITGDSEVSTVVEAMKRGADHFLAKPLEMGDLLREVERQLAAHRLSRQAEFIRVHGIQGGEAVLPEMVGSSSASMEVRYMVSQVARAESSVLLLGESGTGKGLIARGIHRLSRRASANFVELNCASIQVQLLESEIFGHEKGAFTGAVAKKPGLMEIADGGTLFLDEIAEMDAPSQGKLLKALEDHCFRRIGGTKEITSDFRLIAATNHDLEERIASGKFREDLYYRLNVFQIRVPPLRDRLDDIDELVPHFIHRLNPLVGRRIRSVSPRALEILRGYRWPGNVRELRNVIERAMILSKGDQLRVEDLPREIREGRPAKDPSPASLDDVEKAHIISVLEEMRGNIQKTAAVLGISRSTLYEKLKKYGLRQGR